MSCFERSLLGPNSARLSPGPEGNNITHLIPVQRSPRVFPGAGKGEIMGIFWLVLGTPYRPYTYAVALASTWNTIHHISCIRLLYVLCLHQCHALPWALLALHGLSNAMLSHGLFWPYMVPRTQPCAPFPPRRFDCLVAIVTAGKKMV